MAIPTFKGFLKENNTNYKIKLAASLIESRKFPIHLFADWYANYGIYLPQKKYEKVLKEAWYHDYGQAALQGAAAGAAGGLAAGGLGAGAGALGGAAGLLYKGGKDLYNWASDKGYFGTVDGKYWQNKFSASAKEAEKILLQLKEMSKKMVAAKVTNSETFEATLDAMIKSLGEMSAGRPGLAQGKPLPETPTTPSTPDKTPEPMRPIDKEKIDKEAVEIFNSSLFKSFLEQPIVKSILQHEEKIKEIPDFKEYAVTPEMFALALTHLKQQENKPFDDVLRQFEDEFLKVEDTDHFFETAGTIEVYDKIKDSEQFLKALVPSMKIQGLLHGHVRSDDDIYKLINEISKKAITGPRLGP